jgi:hypothetical protein
MLISEVRTFITSAGRTNPTGLKEFRRATGGVVRNGVA